MKLSDELKRCLDGSGCGDCEHYEADTKFTCRGLLEKAYERIKWYEDMFPCEVGDTIYVLTYDSPTGIEETVCKKIHIFKNHSEIEAPCQYDDWGKAKWFLSSNKFGEIWFTDEEQAEAELKKNEEVEGNTNGKTDKTL